MTAAHHDLPFKTRYILQEQLLTTVAINAAERHWIFNAFKYEILQ